MTTHAQRINARQDKIWEKCLKLKRKRDEAIQYLTRRYYDQCERFPLMRDEISLELYLQRNVRYLVRGL